MMMILAGHNKRTSEGSFYLFFLLALYASSVAMLGSLLRLSSAGSTDEELGTQGGRQSVVDILIDRGYR